MASHDDQSETDRNAGVTRAGTADQGRISFDTPTSRHLEAALDTDRLDEKNYHIRSALQRTMIAEQNRPD
ncbi:hypothetical protein [Haloplanus pelagicus]|jgi:hypothetical protein|uniref:hypothetical protein n=1 Tax=Haloplanus pelagicus TaxID=2949995 RepID=UPI00203D3CDA|nr:hypothetical protein [Haloplanus sp. HW8-1]